MSRIKQTLKEEADALEWGPSVWEPEGPERALQYALDVLGSQTEDRSLGVVYAYKRLLWLKEKLAEAFSAPTAKADVASKQVFRIEYSSELDAKKYGFPPNGTIVEIGGVEDVLALQESVGGNRIIFHEDGYEPCWLDYDMNEDLDYVDRSDWRGYRWLEVYNGKRE